MRKFLLYLNFHVFVLCSSHVLAWVPPQRDSLLRKVETWTFTPRFNTLNMAPVSGGIANDHVNFDCSFVYVKNRFMWMIAEAFDLQDKHSDMNYLLTNIRYKISLTKNLSVSPFLAYYSEHAYQLIDPISDFNSGMIISFQRGPFTMEAFVLFVRLTHEPARKDLINRYEIRYKWGPIMFSGFVYQNTEYFDGKKRLAVGFRAMLPEFKILNGLNARSEITGSFKVQETPETNNLSGVFLSIAFPFRY